MEKYEYVDKYEYRDEIKEKVKKYIKEKINLKDFEDPDLGMDWESLVKEIKDTDYRIESPLINNWFLESFVTENMQLFKLAFYESDKSLDMVGKMFTENKWEQLEKIMFDYTFEQAIYEVLEDMGCDWYIGKYDKELGGEELRSTLEKIYERSDIDSSGSNNDDGTEDLVFVDESRPYRASGGLNYWFLRRVNFEDDWTDKDIRDAIDWVDGSNIDLGEVMDEGEYRDEIKEKVKEYIDKKINLKEYWNPQEGMDWDELYSSIYDQSNIQSSLPFWHQREFILRNMDTFQAARIEDTLSDKEIGQRLLDEDWDGLEGIIFNYWFDHSINEVLNEMKEMNIDQLMETKRTLKM